MRRNKAEAEHFRGYACALAMVVRQHHMMDVVKDAVCGQLAELRRFGTPDDVRWIEYAHGGPHPLDIVTEDDA